MRYLPYYCLHMSQVAHQVSTYLCSGLMVSGLDSGLSDPGLSPGRGHSVAFLGKTLNSHSASLHPGV